MNIFQLEQAPSSPHNPKMDKLLRKQTDLITLPPLQKCHEVAIVSLVVSAFFLFLTQALT